jgi:hypothetical protein
MVQEFQPYYKRARKTQWSEGMAVRKVRDRQYNISSPMPQLRTWKSVPLDQYYLT